MQYLSTFITGLQDVVLKIIGESLPDIRVIDMFDGAMLFESRFAGDRINTRCINNLFIVIDVMRFKQLKEGTAGSGSVRNPIQMHMKRLLSEGNSLTQSKRDSIRLNGTGDKSFRIVTSHENKLISVDDGLKRGIEELINKNSGLALDRSGADAEYWFLYRSEGFCFFMKRLTRHRAYDKILCKGELHPELAYMLNIISEPSPNDVFLDAFSGYGAIPIQRMLNFNANKIYSFDNDKRLINIQKEKIKGLQVRSGQKIELRQLDFMRLDKELGRGSCDKIVTDPPWGVYEPEKLQQLSIVDFYEKMLRKFAYALRDGGAAVILTSRSGELRDLISMCTLFGLEKEYQILVSGKKAAIYKLSRHTDSYTF